MLEKLRTICRTIFPATVAIFALTWLAAAPGSVLAQQSGEASPSRAGSSADVRVDGKVLFQVRGISAFPAADRARTLARRIEALAEDESVPPEAIAFRAEEDHYTILAADAPIARLYDFDAALEDVPLPVLAEVISVRVADAVRKYRADRSPEALSRSALFSALLTAGLILLVWGLAKLRRWLERVLRARVDASVKNLERKSGSVIHRGHLWRLSQGLLQALWILALLVIAYFYLSSVLGTFPWTRGAALLLLEYVRSPLVAMGSAFVGSIPDLIFLVVLWFIVRYLLRTLRTFFRAVGQGRVQLQNFEREWADPTYRLLRIAVIAFAIVIAYPYIPGSESAAFKGVSLFLGVIVSLGSTSFIANLIAGIALTYRGVFREGDWVEIDGAEGRVEQIRAQLVQLRTRDNERLSIPSSTILNTNVTNLSEQADGNGLVLRCPIGLGYDVAWRRAEELLLAAAQGLEGVLQDPAPVVHVRELGDFAVQYVLVVRIADPGPLPAIRTQLNEAILDRFHGAGIQIMSPAYENDPAEPKIPSAGDGPK
ncbi:MAG: mechanosensitive ion channel [Gammaproteobacteria bacterium]